MKLVREDGWFCADDVVAVDVIYSWDATSLKGSWDGTTKEAGCGKARGDGLGPPNRYTLVKVG